MSCSVVIVDDRHDVLELNRILLEAEGYETRGFSYADITSDLLRQSAPCVMLLDLVPGDVAPWELMRRVRGDPATQEMGLVVTSDSPAPVDTALRDTSLGVSAGLVMPFDIDALYNAIATAARGGSAAAPATLSIPLLRRAATIMRDLHQRLLMRWVQRISTLEAFRRRPDLTLRELQGQGDALLDGIVDALELQGSSRAVEATTAGIHLDAARDHARLRRAQGAGSGDLAREIAMLRREIWREINPAMKKDALPLDDIWTLQRCLHMALDETLCAMLDAWDESTPR